MDLTKLNNLERYAGSEIPMEDWRITAVFGDILLCKFVDAEEGPGGGEFVVRNGISIPLDVTKHTWRIVKVLQIGPDASSLIKVGDYLMIPNDKGLPCVQKNGNKREKLIFINQDRVFCRVEPKKTGSK